MSKPNLIEQWGHHIVAFSVTRPWLVTVTLLAICVALSSGAATLKFAGDYRVFFGSNNPDIITNQEA